MVIVIIWTHKAKLFYPVFLVFFLCSVYVLFSVMWGSQAHVYNKCKKALNCLWDEMHKHPVSCSPGTCIGNPDQKKKKNPTTKKNPENHTKDIFSCGVPSFVHGHLSLSKGVGQPKKPREEAVRKHWVCSQQALKKHAMSILNQSWLKEGAMQVFSEDRSWHALCWWWLHCRSRKFL